MELLSRLAVVGLDTVRDEAPLIGIVLFFQIVVLRRRLANTGQVVVGFVYVTIGLALFLIGLEQALFPLGKTMAAQLTDPAFLGIAEGPRLIGSTMAGSMRLRQRSASAPPSRSPRLWPLPTRPVPSPVERSRPWGLRIAVAIGVAIGVGLGAVRIVIGLPLHYLIMAGYAIVIVQTIFATRTTIPLAYDSGGVTTSTVTVPLVAALGLGLAANVPGRSPLIDGFGLIAFASVFPIIAVLGYAQLASVREAMGKRRRLRHRH